MQVIALYDYKPEQPDELGFQEGDVLQVVHVQDDGWWSGYNAKDPDSLGLFPSNYVKAQQANLSQGVVEGATTLRIQQLPRQMPDMSEAKDGNENDDDDDMAHESRGGYRGHMGAVLQLRKNLSEAGRTSEAVQDPRWEVERERWRHREQEDMSEEEFNHSGSIVIANRQRQESSSKVGGKTEDSSRSAYPQRQRYMNENDLQLVEEDFVGKDSSEDKGNKAEIDVQCEQVAGAISAENAAAMLIARHIASFQKYRKQAAGSKQSRNLAAIGQADNNASMEQSIAGRRKLENKAATDVQRWIRLRWACFWCRRVRIERKKRDDRAAEETRQERGSIRAELCRGENLQKVEDEEELSWEGGSTQRIEQKEEAIDKEKQAKVLQHGLEDEAQEQPQVDVGEEDMQRRLMKVQVGSVATSLNDQSFPHNKYRRKVVKKEAAELIKTLVQQQLQETLRDQDAKVEELQRMVARLQTVVRKQTVMLEDSMGQLESLQMGQRLPIKPKSNDAGSHSFLPRSGVQSGLSRQPGAASGLRAPRPVLLSKLPILARNATCNSSKKT